MRIATWNVNSIKQRIENLTAWLKERSARHRLPAGNQERRRRLPARADRGAGLQRRSPRPEDLQRRRHPVEVQVRRGDAAAARRRRRRPCPLHRGRRFRPTAARCGWRRSTCPTATRPDTEKYPYKIRWMDRLSKYAHERLQLEEPLVLAGDYNVIPTADDVHNPAVWANDALFLPQTREKFRALTNLGLTDAIRAVSDDAGSTRSGTIRPAPGRRTGASASTTCCCRRRPPTGSPAPASTSTSAPGSGRPTTCRSMSDLAIEAALSREASSARPTRGGLRPSA